MWWQHVFAKKMYPEHVISNGMTCPENLYMTAQEKAKFTWALNPDVNKAPWHKDQLMKIMKEMVAAKERYLKYEKVCSSIGKDAVDLLVANNLLHLRPVKRISNDLTMFQF